MEKLIAWVEIPATDFKRAVNFYNNVLDIELQEIDCGTEKMACFPTGEGAISWAPGFNPSKEGVLVSLNTGNQLDQTIARVKVQGGVIVHPKTKIEAEGRGFFAVFTDSEGNKVGLYGDL
jgi:predicted enzyme related to lactoylglutathione lyase